MPCMYGHDLLYSNASGLHIYLMALHVCVRNYVPLRVLSLPVGHAAGQLEISYTSSPFRKDWPLRFFTLNLNSEKDSAVLFALPCSGLFFEFTNLNLSWSIYSNPKKIFGGKSAKVGYVCSDPQVKGTACRRFFLTRGSTFVSSLLMNWSFLALRNCFYFVQSNTRSHKREQNYCFRLYQL